MLIAGIQKSSTIDFPGNLSCVLFTQGCNFDCFYCHNRDLILQNKNQIATEEIFSFLNRRKGLLDGVVISGGEPTLQPDLVSFISKIKSMGYLIKLDTNGQLIQPVKELVRKHLIDYVAVDWKAPKDEFPFVCRSNTGYDHAKKTIQYLLETGIPFEARTTLYPGLTKDHLIKLLSELPPLPLYRLNFYHVPKKYRKEDGERIFSSSLTPNEIMDMKPELIKVQPNLTF